MSGGGSSGNKKSDKKKDEPVIPGTGPMMTQPAFMPGMDTALAQQLAAGFGGDPASFLAQFQQTYAPMQILDTRPGATPAPVPPPASTPTTPQGGRTFTNGGRQGLGRLMSSAAGGDGRSTMVRR